MQIWQAIIIGILYWLAEANLPFISIWTFQRPLVCGWLTGCILGDPVSGAVIGGTINLVYLGFISAGGSMPADMALAGILGTAYAIVGNLSADTALAIAVPLGLLGTIIWYLRMTFNSTFVHWGDRYIAEGKFNKLFLTNVVYPQMFAAVLCVIPCGLAAYFGAEYIQDFINLCAGKPLQIFQIIGGMMPALGIAITLQYIFKGGAKVFLFVGFMIATVSGMTLIEQGIIALLMAIIYTQIESKIATVPALPAGVSKGVDDPDDPDYDPDYDPDDE